MKTRDIAKNIVIGLIAPTGIDKHTIIDKLNYGFQSFQYNVKYLSVSKHIIPELCPFVVPTPENERISTSMDAGNLIREKTKDNSILMKAVINSIYGDRLKEKDSDNSHKGTAYIIDSIKNPDEVALLRSVYGTGFHLIGISSSKENRHKTLIEREIAPEEAKLLINRDESEENNHGQKTRDAFQECDYFISADANNTQVKFDVERLLHLLFGEPFVTPTFDEYAMFIAYSASLRSADLSRQIGAAIARNNEIISIGANDCPKACGGLYWPERNIEGKIVDEKGGRDYTIGYDSNKFEQQKLIQEILGSVVLEEDKKIDLEKKLYSSTISYLTEFGRVVHAEMEAITMCARNGISCRGANLYTTTFPCHNCAKHIISSGITKVVYIEPYPKSRAFDFYKIEISDKEESGKIWFTPFNGVGPHRFIDLFAMKTQTGYQKYRKDSSGKNVAWNNKNAALRLTMPVTTYYDYEIFISNDYLLKLEEFKEE